MTLFEKYGGVPTVTSIVKSFYLIVLKNHKLKIYFSEINSQKLIEHQIVFISHLLGKPSSENINFNSALKQTHRGKRISESAYTEIMHILEGVLILHNIKYQDILTIMSIISGFKEYIVELPTIIRTA